MRNRIMNRNIYAGEKPVFVNLLISEKILHVIPVSLPLLIEYGKATSLLHFDVHS